MNEIDLLSNYAKAKVKTVFAVNHFLQTITHTRVCVCAWLCAPLSVALIWSDTLLTTSAGEHLFLRQMFCSSARAVWKRWKMNCVVVNNNNGEITVGGLSKVDQRKARWSPKRGGKEGRKSGPKKKKKKFRCCSSIMSVLSLCDEINSSAHSHRLTYDLFIESRKCWCVYSRLLRPSRSMNR